MTGIVSFGLGAPGALLSFGFTAVVPLAPAIGILVVLPTSVLPNLSANRLITGGLGAGASLFEFGLDGDPQGTTAAPISGVLSPVYDGTFAEAEPRKVGVVRR